MPKKSKDFQAFEKKVDKIIKLITAKEINYEKLAKLIAEINTGSGPQANLNNLFPKIYSPKEQSTREQVNHFVAEKTTQLTDKQLSILINELFKNEVTIENPFRRAEGFAKYFLMRELQRHADQADPNEPASLPPHFLDYLKNSGYGTQYKVSAEIDEVTANFNTYFFHSPQLSPSAISYYTTVPNLYDTVKASIAEFDPANRNTFITVNSPQEAAAATDPAPVEGSKRPSSSGLFGKMKKAMKRRKDKIEISDPYDFKHVGGDVPDPGYLKGTVLDSDDEEMAEPKHGQLRRQPHQNDLLGGAASADKRPDRPSTPAPSKLTNLSDSDDSLSSEDSELEKAPARPRTQPPQLFTSTEQQRSKTRLHDEIATSDEESDELTKSKKPAGGISLFSNDMAQEIKEKLAGQQADPPEKRIKKDKP